MNYDTCACGGCGIGQIPCESGCVYGKYLYIFHKYIVSFFENNTAQDIAILINKYVIDLLVARIIVYFYDYTNKMSIRKVNLWQFIARGLRKYFHFLLKFTKQLSNKTNF